jgi:hypothetical protein
MRYILLLAMTVMFISSAQAGQVKVLSVKFEEKRSSWTVRTTLEHSDEGWKHYADAWRIMGEDGTEYGTRILAHPHVNEQPFTRSLSGVKIPRDVKIVFIEAHDSVHGWSPDRIRVDLTRKDGINYQVFHRR